MMAMLLLRVSIESRDVDGERESFVVLCCVLNEERKVMIRKKESGCDVSSLVFG